MPERGPDGKFLPKNTEVDDALAAIPDEADPTDGVDFSQFAEVGVGLTTIDPDERVAELEALLAQAMDELAEKESVIEGLMPTASITDFMFDSREDVIAFFGEDVLRAKVKDQIATINRKRTRDGYDRLPLTDEEVAGRLDEFIDGLIRDRSLTSPPDEGWLDRTLKMVREVKDHTGKVIERVLVQIPYEGQINNVAGSIADGYIKYEKKGFKRTRPMLCPAKDCWLTAAEADGKWVYRGYCGEDHLKRTARGEDVPEA